MRRFTRLLPYVAILVVLVIAAAVILRVGPLADYLRNFIASEFSKQTGREVSIGSASVTLSGKVVLKDLVIRNKDGTILARAPEVDARVGSPGSLIPILSKPTEVRSVTVTRPEVELVRQKSGELNISDLLEREGKPPSKFRGTVTVKDGTITFADETKGGVATHIEGADIKVTYPSAEKVRFTVKAPRNGDDFEALDLVGESNSETGETTLNVEAEGLDIPYAAARAPGEMTFIRSGRADVKAKLTFGSRKSQRGELEYTIGADVTGAEVEFPWLRRPVKEVMGTVRVENGTALFDDVTGTVAEAPVTLKGEIADFADPTLALEITASGIRYPQIRQLFPKLAFPVGLLLPSPMFVAVSVVGPVSDVRVTGKATVKVIKFRAVPWHDVVGEFQYSDGRLTISRLAAHGSPRQIEANVEVNLKAKTPEASGTVSVVNLPLSMLATMAGIEGEFEGTVEAKVTGELDATNKLSGTFEATGVVYQGVKVDRLSGEFDYADTRVRLRNVKVDGPIAVGALAAELTTAGAYHVTGRLSSLDLSAVGTAGKLAGLQGRCCAEIDVSGEVSKGAASGRLTLGPGELQGRAFTSLSADFSVTESQVNVQNLDLAMGTGDYRGEFSISGWRGPPGEGRLSGRLVLSGVSLAEWIPPQYGGFAPTGTVEGAIELGGTLRDPTAGVDLTLESVSVAGQPFRSGVLRASYAQGRLVIGEAYLSVDSRRIAAAGEVAIAPGPRPLGQRSMEGKLTLEATDIGGWLPPQYESVAPAGTVSGAVELGGQVSSPEVGANLTIAPTDGGTPGRIEVSYATGRLALADVSYTTSGGGQVTVSGSYLLLGPISLSVAVSGIELRDLSAAWRTKYGLAITGRISGDATVAGTAKRPDVDFSAEAESASVNDVQIAGLSAAGGLKSGVLTIRSAVLRLDGSETKLAGSIDTKTQALDLTLSIDETNVGTLLAISDRAIYRLWYAAEQRGEEHKPLPAFYTRIPRPLKGLLTMTVHATGTLSHPEIATTIEDLKDVGFNGRTVGRIHGTARLVLDATSRNHVALEHAMVDLTAEQKISVATLTGTIGEQGTMDLVFDVGNFEMDLLQPWLGLSFPMLGSATINFNIGGSFREPELRGDVFVENLRMGGELPDNPLLTLEALSVSPIEMHDWTLSLEQIRLRSGEMEGQGSAVYPIEDEVSERRANLHLEDATLTPVPGMIPMVFDAYMRLEGNTIILQDGQGLTGEDAAPGIQGKMGTGSFSIGGQVELTDPHLAEWRRNRFDIQANLDKAQVAITDFFDTAVTGSVWLTNDQETGEALLTTDTGGPPAEHPLVLSDAAVGLPPKSFHLPSGGSFVGPKVDMWLLAGENVWFRYGGGRRPTEIRVEPGALPAEGEPHGYLHLTERMSGRDLEMKGEFESREGRLVFPNGVLTLREATAWIEREPGELPTVTISAAADGRVGDYLVSLNPAGQIYPLSSQTALGQSALSLNVDSVPYLEEAYVMALLVGPVITPTPGGRPSIGDILASPTEGMGGGQITGIVLPTIGGAGLPEFGLDVALTGQVRVRLGQRISDRFVISYISPVSGTGPSDQPTLKLNYEITPLLSLGWGVNELDQGRWEVQAFIPF